ncbi:MAG: methyltransferase [Candidatus Binataceae bacterium]
MDFSKLASLAGGHAEARAIQVALKLGLFETLARGPSGTGALARVLGCDPRATELLANALTALTILEKRESGFELAEVARRHLVQSSTEYLGGMILFDGALWETWGKLEDSIRTGKPGRAPDMYQAEPAETERFIRAMDSLVRARGDARWCAEHLDLSAARTIADLGGGPGTYLAEFLRRWPHLRGAIYDLPATLAVAERILAEREPWALARIEMREVDYLSAELSGPIDVIFMSNIIHSEDEMTNAQLMRKCFRALSSGGLVVVKDHIMNDALTAPHSGAVFSLYLLLTTRGRDYSYAEVAGWLRDAGFTGIMLQTLPSPAFTSSMVLARKS